MRARTLSSVLRVLASPLLVAGCGADRPNAPPHIATQTTAPTATATTPPVTPSGPRFENPGGMWMPHQIATHAAKLRELGLEIDPAELSDPTSNTLGAIVSLGSCSASFVSPDGLVITNHHCATGALQVNSTPTQNLLKDGFLAKSRAEERSNGPTARVYVTRAVTDVSDQMLAGIDAIADDVARHKKLESRQKELLLACEKDRPGVRCSVASFYEGAQFYRIEQLEIRDVRLVYAPPAGIGNYGGEIDNWRWPRHSGDFTFFRAYVGKDGMPADYSTENVPFKPPHHLKLASSPLKENDLVFVAGYPGRTYQLKTSAEVAEAVEWFYPRRQKFCEEYIEVLEAAKRADSEVAIKATPMTRGYNNALTNTKGQLEGLVKGGLAEQRAKSEAELRAWIDGDPQRKATYGAVLDEMAKVNAERVAHREKDASTNELYLAKLLGAANQIVRMAEERPKADADRDPDYQQRNWRRLEQAQSALAKGYHPLMDRVLLKHALERIARHPESEKSDALGIVLGASASPRRGQLQADEAIARAVDALYAKTTIEPEAARLDLLKKATTADLRRSNDPLIKLALALRPLTKAIQDRDDKYVGRMALLKPKYIKALREFAGKEVAPDANGTLRITYGTVRGYRPTPESAIYRPFTVLPEVVAKNKDEEPFNTPARLVEAVRAKKFGPYVDQRLHEVPVDFLSDLHITGGNSGSATLNAKGELVGLAFDGNYEAMGSDWLFQPKIARTIHVDLRYIEWVMDAVDGAHDLLREMGRTPAIK